MVDSIFLYFFLFSVDFAALLTKKTSSSGNGGQQHGASLAEMATGRFSFQKRHLYFSLVLPAPSSPEADAGTAVVQQHRPPRYLQFLSEDGNILEEQELATNDYYNATGKVAVPSSSSSSSSFAFFFPFFLPFFLFSFFLSHFFITHLSNEPMTLFAPPTRLLGPFST